MTTTLAPTKTALWERRKVATEKRDTLAMYRRTLCGCVQCGDMGRIEEVDALIVRATQVVLELSDQITDRTPTC